MKERNYHFGVRNKNFPTLLEDYVDDDDNDYNHHYHNNDNGNNYSELWLYSCWSR